jgi:hypothetical protein
MSAGGLGPTEHRYGGSGPWRATPKTLGRISTARRVDEAKPRTRHSPVSVSTRATCVARRSLGARVTAVWTSRGRDLMSLHFAGITFGRHHYDARGDVLYVSVASYDGAPAKAFATPEGHCVEYDVDGRVIGMILVNVRWLLERDGELTPEHVAARCRRRTRRGREVV